MRINILILVIIGFGVSLASISLINVFNSKNAKLPENLAGISVGKEFTIIIPDETVVTAEYINKVINHDIEYQKPFFDLINIEAREELINYMFDNNFIIKPGEYVINQAWKFDQIKEALIFSKQ